MAAARPTFHAIHGGPRSSSRSQQLRRAADFTRGLDYALINQPIELLAQGHTFFQLSALPPQHGFSKAAILRGRDKCSHTTKAGSMPALSAVAKKKKEVKKDKEKEKKLADKVSGRTHICVRDCSQALVSTSSVSVLPGHKQIIVQ